MSAQTFGSWRLEQSPQWPWSYRIVGADETTILRYDLWTYSTSDTQSSANARPENEQCHAFVRLLSAAPTMLEALEAICEALEDDDSFSAVQIARNFGRAAIAAAKGEQ